MTILELSRSIQLITQRDSALYLMMFYVQGNVTVERIPFSQVRANRSVLDTTEERCMLVTFLHKKKHCITSTRECAPAECMVGRYACASIPHFFHATALMPPPFLFICGTTQRWRLYWIQAKLYLYCWPDQRQLWLHRCQELDHNI